MIDCRHIKTPEQAKQFMDEQLDKAQKLSDKVDWPKPPSGSTSGPAFERFCDFVNELQAAKRYLMKAGLIHEDTEGRYA